MRNPRPLKRYFWHSLRCTNAQNVGPKLVESSPRARCPSSLPRDRFGLCFTTDFHFQFVFGGFQNAAAKLVCGPHNEPSCRIKVQTVLKFEA